MGTAKAPTSFSNRGAAIEQAARHLLVRHRFDAITVEQLVEAVGVSKPVFYEHFPSKEALGVRLSLQSLRQAFDRLTTLRTSRPGVDALRCLIEWAIEQHFGNGNAGFARLLASVDDVSVRVAERRWLAGLERLIANAQATRGGHHAAPPRIVAGTLYSILKDGAFDRALREGAAEMGALKEGITRLLLG